MMSVYCSESPSFRVTDYAEMDNTSPLVWEAADARALRVQKVRKYNYCNAHLYYVTCCNTACTSKNGKISTLHIINKYIVKHSFNELLYKKIIISTLCTNVRGNIVWW
jgi:hypothetical protein